MLQLSAMMETTHLELNILQLIHAILLTLSMATHSGNTEHPSHALTHLIYNPLAVMLTAFKVPNTVKLLLHGLQEVHLSTKINPCSELLEMLFQKLMPKRISQKVM